MPEGQNSTLSCALLIFPARRDYPAGAGWSKPVACAGAGDGGPNRWLSFSHPRIGYRLTKFDTGYLSLRPDIGLAGPKLP